MINRNWSSTGKREKGKHLTFSVTGKPIINSGDNGISMDKPWSTTPTRPISVLDPPRKKRQRHNSRPILGPPGACAWAQAPLRCAWGEWLLCLTELREVLQYDTMSDMYIISYWKRDSARPLPRHWCEISSLLPNATEIHSQQGLGAPIEPNCAHGKFGAPCWPISLWQLEHSY